MAYYLTGLIFCIFCAKRMHAAQQGKSVFGWNVLISATLLVLLLCAESSSPFAEDNALSRVMMVSPALAAAPMLMHSRNHPLTLAAGWLISLLAGGLLYYILQVLQVIFSTPYGQEVPWWVQMWLPEL
ncbi:MAG: hypothetical protein IKV82_00615 [Akkermansia sp.]|nr:hypothetical protein [Akkermansia sp.]